MSDDFQIGRWSVNRETGQMVSGNKRTRIKPMLMRLLLYLAKNSGFVVSKRQIIENVWLNAHVSDDAMSRAVFELRKALGDDAKNPRFIETIPKRGYRVIAPVRDLEEEGRTAGRNLRYAILPFETFSQNDQIEHLGLVMTDLLTTGLAKAKTVRVVSVISGMACRNMNKVLPKIAKELNVDRIIEGSIIQVKGSTRIMVRLLDALADEHLWAEVYDCQGKDLLAAQCEIAAAIVAEIVANA